MQRQYWNKTKRVTHCKHCKVELAPHKVYYCTSECGWKFRYKYEPMVK